MPRGVYERKPRTAADPAGAAPPQSKKKRKYTRRSRPTAARARSMAAERFIPAFTADNRLLIVNGGEPQIFDPKQTEAIATLLLNHFDT